MLLSRKQEKDGSSAITGYVGLSSFPAEVSRAGVNDMWRDLGVCRRECERCDCIGVEEREWLSLIQESVLTIASSVLVGL